MIQARNGQMRPENGHDHETRLECLIAWVLEEDGYRVLIQAWDFVPGTNWVQGMQTGTRDAQRTIAVLSSAYLGSVFAGAEWQAAWAGDPHGADRRLLVVQVAECERPGLLSGTAHPVMAERAVIVGWLGVSDQTIRYSRVAA